jgi:hypothetical protein
LNEEAWNKIGDAAEGDNLTIKMTCNHVIEDINLEIESPSEKKNQGSLSSREMVLNNNNNEQKI